LKQLARLPLLVFFASLACIYKEDRADAPKDPAPPAPIVIAIGPTLALYMPGSNLEDSMLVRGSWQTDEESFLPPGERSRFGGASDDLRELVEGFRSLPPYSPVRPSLWVAFGGARKAGWRGVRYADLACLTADAADEIFGNADCYAFLDVQADMSEAETLARFLGFVKARIGPAGTNVLVLWGQGGAHEGVLYDTAHQEIPFMRLPQLRQALKRANAHWDLLGLDSSMMASLEALDVVRPYTPLVVASPDRAPGHGWDYRALARKLAEANVSALALARSVADSFMDGQSLTLEADGHRREVPHRETRAKMISVIDARKVEAVIARLDALVAAARPVWPQLMSAFVRAPPVGRERKTDTTEAMDLTGAARRASELVPALAARADAVLRAVDEAVLYTRRDPSLLVPSKLTVFTPVSDKLWRSGYAEAELLSPAWRDFLAQQVAKPLADVRPPVVRPRRGLVAISDDTRLLPIEVLRAETTGRGLWRVWQSSAPAVVSSTGDGRAQTVSVAPWDGRVVWLCNGTCDTRVPVPTQFEGTLAGGHTLLSSAVLVRDLARKTDGEDATLFVELDRETVVATWIAPIEVDTEARVLFSREQYRLEQGLSIAFYALEKNDPAMPPYYKQSAFFDLTHPPHWHRAPFSRRLFSMIAASDLNHNQTYFPLGR
jgi:hypothetical protein